MKVFNTLTRRKEEFVTLVPGEVKMYVCGGITWIGIYFGVHLAQLEQHLVR